MIIGISGLSETPDGQKCSIQTGKDEVARIFIQDLGFVSVSLADELKRFCMRVFDFSEDQLWGDLKAVPDKRYPREHVWTKAVDRCLCCGAEWAGEQCYLTPRYAMQLLGTEWGRYCYWDIWVEYTMRISNQLQKGGCCYNRVRGLEFPPEGPVYSDVVIPDVRFPNELHGIQRLGGKVVRVKRKIDSLPPGDMTHASETSLFDVPDSEFDGLILNYSTLEDLKDFTRKSVETWGILSKC